MTYFFEDDDDTNTMNNFEELGITIRFIRGFVNYFERNLYDDYCIDEQSNRRKILVKIFFRDLLHLLSFAYYRDKIKMLYDVVIHTMYYIEMFSKKYNRKNDKILSKTTLYDSLYNILLKFCEKPNIAYNFIVDPIYIPYINYPIEFDYNYENGINMLIDILDTYIYEKGSIIVYTGNEKKTYHDWWTKYKINTTYGNQSNRTKKGLAKLLISPNKILSSHNNSSPRLKPATSFGGSTRSYRNYNTIKTNKNKHNNRIKTFKMKQRRTKKYKSFSNINKIHK
jgi:hypothetical protein